MLRAMASDPFHTLAARGRPRQILVVDDDPPSREGLNTAFLREGHVVDTAADAWQAIVRLRAHPFDIAVVDLDLPAVHGVDLGGWDVVQIARAYQPAIGVIVLSSDEDPTPGPEARALDVNAVLGKPISLQQLTDLVDRLPLPGPRAPRSAIGR
jgi:two-component system, OmpR family, response regulator